MGLPTKLPREKEGYWLTKDNKLIMMHGNMTATSYKITNFFLWKALQENKLDDLKVNGATIVRECGIKDTNYTKILLEECKRVALTQISVLDNDNNWKIRQIIPSLTYEKGILSADINPKIAPYIQGLTKGFTKNDYAQINKCSSYSGMRMYEVCNSWYRTGFAYYTVEEWRKLLGATQKSYEKFPLFRTRILEPAINTVNKQTDLQISQEYIKTGRKTSHIRIRIQRKSDIPEDVELQPSDKDNKINMISEEEAKVTDSIFLNLQEQDCAAKMHEQYNIPLTIARNNVKEKGIGYCMAQMQYVHEVVRQQKVNNVGGYLIRALEDDYAGMKQKQYDAYAAEVAEHKEVADWNHEIAAQQSLFDHPGGDNDEGDLVEQILNSNQSLANMYREMNIPDRCIARWMEKYPSPLMLRVAKSLKDADGITAEYVSACLKTAAGM